MLDADVALPVVKSFMDSIRDKAVGAAVLKSVRPDQQVIKIVNDGLVEMLGGEAKPLLVDVTPPAVILMAGLQVRAKQQPRASLLFICKQSIKKGHAGQFGSHPACRT